MKYRRGAGAAGDLLRAAGVDMGTVYFHGNNKSPEELALAVRARVGRIVIDNLGEVALVEAAAAAVLYMARTASSGDTFDMRLVGWRKVASNINQSLILWVPVSLVEVSCTVSTPVGIANADVVATERFCDTLALKTAYQSKGSIEVISPANDTIAHLLADFKGFQKIEFLFDSTAAGLTEMNCLYVGY